MTRQGKAVGLTLLILLGIGIACSGIVLHLALPKRYERIEIIPIVVGFAIALYAAYWKDPHRAEQAATGVTRVGADVVHSAVELRSGERHDPAPPAP